MRSGTFGALSAGAGTTLVGLLSALMTGGSPLRGDPHEAAIGERPARAEHGKREDRGNRDHAAAFARLLLGSSS